MQKLTVSKCCASPLLTKYGEEGTNFFLCQSCHNPADQMTYPFSTIGEMTAWLKRRKAYRGMAYTANSDLTTKPMRVPPLAAFLVGCAIGIFLFWALVAR